MGGSTGLEVVLQERYYRPHLRSTTARLVDEAATSGAVLPAPYRPTTA
jgi:hypothetical protein